MGNIALRLAALLILLAALAVPEERRRSLDSHLPCSLEEIGQGIRNWRDHREYSNWCGHPLAERFHQRCLQIYWNRFD